MCLFHVLQRIGLVDLDLHHAAPDNKLYKLYLKRIADFRDTTPGPLWNGTWVHTEK